MNERIKKLRKELDLTQQEFAERIGVKRNTVATYEMGRSEPSDAGITLICREFKVNEEWLRAGSGEMFRKELIEDEYINTVMEIGNGGSDLLKSALTKYGRLSPTNKKIIDEALSLIANILKEGE